MDNTWTESDVDFFAEACGGKSNILQVENCLTRLRVVLKEKENFSKEKLLTLPGVKLVLCKRDELQLVIGIDVYSIETICNERLKLV